MKTLKCVCKFYFDRWWLPLLCLPIWNLFAFWTVMGFSKFTMATDDYDVLVTSFLTLMGELEIMLWLGVPISWIWLSFHKQKLKSLLSFWVAISAPFILFLCMFMIDGFHLITLLVPWVLCFIVMGSL